MKEHHVYIIILAIFGFSFFVSTNPSEKPYLDRFVEGIDSYCESHNVSFPHFEYDWKFTDTIPDYKLSQEPVYIKNF